MAVTVGRSAERAVKQGVFAALNVVALKTTLGASANPAYTVKVYGTVPQTLTYPHVRVDAAGEVPNNTFGINGKDCRAYVNLFDSDPSEGRLLDIQSLVIALLNPAGNYHALNVPGYTVIHVNYDGATSGEPHDDGNGVRVFQRTVMFTVTVEEA
jgi:hypothetical protein